MKTKRQPVQQGLPALLHPSPTNRCPFFVWRLQGISAAYWQAQVRLLALAEVRAYLKARGLRYASLAGGKSVSFTGEVLRGNYPHYKAGQLTAIVYRRLIDFRVPVPPELKPFYLALNE